MIKIFNLRRGLDGSYVWLRALETPRECSVHRPPPTFLTALGPMKAEKKSRQKVFWLQLFIPLSGVEKATKLNHGEHKSVCLGPPADFIQ